MDEADNLIAQTLVQSGWTKDVCRPAAMTGEDLVPLVAWALGRISGSGDSSEAFPKGVAQRHRLAAALAEQIKSHGYAGECGYNHLLYPTEYDTRQLLLWLVQKLPKVDRDDADDESPEMHLRKSLTHALGRWMEATASQRKAYIADKQPFATDPKLLSQHKQLSFLELNSSLRTPGELSSHSLMQEASLVSEDVATAFKKLSMAPPATAAALPPMDTWPAPLVNSGSRRGHSPADARHGDGRGSQHGQAPGMFAPRCVTDQQSLCDESARRLEGLAAEWAAHRQPLDDAIAARSAARTEYEADCRELQATIALYRAEMAALGEISLGTLEQKKAQRQAIERKYAAAPKAVNRSVYTTRIMDIIKQVHKQKAEIAKILQDIRSVQKQINVSSEKLKRSEAIAEERLYHAASDAGARGEKRAQYVECYRLFATIRELFDELIRWVTRAVESSHGRRCITEGGKRENQTRDLSNWIAQLSARLSVAHCDQIEADLRQVRTENAALVARLQAQP
ncbi:hypothetical protein ACHHYP_12903 [Achlya hypogyna]|uniref:Uncharacterized protein n=1 Tax=Achlya hypogyna TaxID=1202772 RepID=A0A1V9ZG25_ACHHY|nr:hypothetical protein ACHHYP_12903 [Achlya hypogyna]